jgi:hypothetical protein
MARMLDWTAAFLPRETTTAMRAAENEAKLQQLRLWRGYVAPTIQVNTIYHLVLCTYACISQTSCVRLLQVLAMQQFSICTAVRGSAAVFGLLTTVHVEIS